MAKRKVSSTQVEIYGRGLSFIEKTIDHDTFLKLTQNVLTQTEYDDLYMSVREGDYVVCAPFAEGTEVRLGNQAFTSSWENIRHQCHDTLPQAQRIYDGLGESNYKIIQQELHRGAFVQHQIDNCDINKFWFELECIELAKGIEFLIMTPSYAGDDMNFGWTMSHSLLFIVDCHGNPYDILTTEH